MRNWILAACLVTGLATSATAEWVAIGTASNSAVWKADPSRIRTVGSARQIWVKIDHSRDTTTSYRESMNLFAVDCRAQTYKLLATTKYDSYGKTISSNTFPSYGSTYGFTPIVPESMLEAVSLAACAGQ